MGATPPEVIPADAPEAVDRVVEALTAGGVVVLPTDTVYGLAACPDDAGAMARVFELKGRAADVPVAVLCASTVQALSLAGTVGSRAAALAATHWPGPLTLVLARADDVELHLGEPVRTIGVRCPDHALLRAVATRIGPVAATSANRHGEPTPTSALGAASSLTGLVDLVIDGGELPGAASTVVADDGGSLRVLRAGPIPVDP